MITIDYICDKCDTTIKLEVSYFDGDLDEATPEECPICQHPTDNTKQIDRKYQDAINSP